jgi:hypothetical protein
VVLLVREEVLDGPQQEGPEPAALAARLGDPPALEKAAKKPWVRSRAVSGSCPRYRMKE